MKEPDNPPANTSTRLRAILRSKRVWIALTLASAVIIVGAIRTQIVSAFQEDACQQISLMIAEKIDEGDALTPELVNDTVSSLIRASVINGQIDTEGNPTDYNGNAFQIVVAEGTVTTLTSRSSLHPFRSHASSYLNP
jgi:hypothetical protein